MSGALASTEASGRCANLGVWRAAVASRRAELAADDGLAPELAIALHALNDGQSGGLRAVTATVRQHASRPTGGSARLWRRSSYQACRPQSIGETPTEPPENPDV